MALVERPADTDRNLYLAFVRCTECRVDINVHVYGRDAVGDALIDAIERHMRDAHYAGEPVEIVTECIEVRGVA